MKVNEQIDIEIKALEEKARKLHKDISIYDAGGMDTRRERLWLDEYTERIIMLEAMQRGINHDEN